jgi:hypothetical protein
MHVKRRVIVLGVGAAALAVAGAFAAVRLQAGECEPAPSDPLRYRHVAPIFAEGCGRCHDGRVSDNTGALKVFDSRSYPFATERPDRLLEGLRSMFESRGGIEDADRCRVLQWLDGGARDDRGERPPYGG